MKQILIITTLLIITQLTFAAQKLSPQAQISLITYGTSAQVHTMYGHSAIRVKDQAQGIDYVFNYGIFSFSKPNFIYRFAKGQTDYLLAIFDFNRSAKSYKEEQRYIYQQNLALTPQERQRLFNALLLNANPKNREYRYNFFYDNCATRIHNIISQNIDGKIQYTTPTHKPKTLRQWINHYQQVMPWTNFGIDLVVGAPADIRATPYQEMFLPEQMSQQFAKAKIVSPTATRNLVTSHEWIYKPEQLPQLTDEISPVSWILFALFVLLLLLSIFEQYRNKHYIIIDVLTYGIIGIAGVVITWMTIYSEHPAMHPNYNVIWALPTHLLFAIALMKRSWRKPLQRYHMLTAISLVTFWTASFIITQSFPAGVYWLTAILALRVAIGLYESFYKTTLTQPHL